MIEQTLQKLGWSEKQIQVYLTLLKMGPASVRTLAAASGINRGTTYDILKQLQELGCVGFYHKATKQYFFAEDPKNLRTVLDARARELADVKENLDELLPQLSSLRSSGEEQPISLLYEGKNGIRQILEDVLERSARYPSKSYYAYSTPSVRSEVYLAMPEFTKRRLERKIGVQVIAFDEGTLQGLDERRTLSSGEYPADTYVFIYAGRVAYITKNAAGEPVGMVIDNPGIYQTESLVFQALWNNLGA
jgi:sugar-specific transcriptional regulator TrmB